MERFEPARISRLDVIPRLLELAAGQTARLFNISELASPFQLSRPTIRDYVTLLERIFLLEQLPPWHSNRLSRLIKTPKLHLGDTGLAASLLGVDSAALTKDRDLLRQLLESFVYQELRRQASWSENAIRFYHLRLVIGFQPALCCTMGRVLYDLRTSFMLCPLLRFGGDLLPGFPQDQRASLLYVIHHQTRASV